MFTAYLKWWDEHWWLALAVLGALLGYALIKVRR
jgi:hypothetical protein